MVGVRVLPRFYADLGGRQVHAGLLLPRRPGVPRSPRWTSCPGARSAGAAPTADKKALVPPLSFMLGHDACCSRMVLQKATATLRGLCALASAHEDDTMRTSVNTPDAEHISGTGHLYTSAARSSRAFGLLRDGKQGKAPPTAWWLSRYRMMSAVRRNSSVPTTRAK